MTSRSLNLSGGNDVTICRLMNQNDANIYGNVHGGVILHMIEEAGLIISTRYCNADKSSGQKVAATMLARVERTDFLQPMYVGEVAHLHGRITFTSPHSLEVKITVQAENILKGGVRLTNKAKLWYVPRLADGGIDNVKPLTTLTTDEEREGQLRYEWQKQTRNAPIPPMFDDWARSLDNPNSSGERFTVSNSLTTLVHFVNVTDCQMYGKLPGGFAMKIMDEVAGICAARHCHTPCVTASMDATDFYRSIEKGSIINVRGRMIYTSQKSLIVQVVVVAETHKADSASETFCGCSAFFTYVSLDKNGKTLPVPPLKLTNKDEKDRYDEGEKMYLRQKRIRSQSITQVPSVTVTQRQPPPPKSSPTDETVHNHTPNHINRRWELPSFITSSRIDMGRSQQPEPPSMYSSTHNNHPSSHETQCLQLVPYVAPPMDSSAQSHLHPQSHNHTPSRKRQSSNKPMKRSFGIALPPPKEKSITQKLPCRELNFFTSEITENDPFNESHCNITSKRGKRKFTHDDFVYVFDLQSKKDPTISFWRCERKNACKGRIHVQNGQFLKMINWHSHGPSPVDVAVAEVKSALKRKAGDDFLQPAELVKKCINNVSIDVQEQLPKTNSMRQIVRRARIKLDNPTTDPISGLDLLKLGQTS